MIDEHVLDVDYLEECKKSYSKKEYSKLIVNIDKILKSDDYKELLINYKEYVLNLCELFGDLNVTLPLDIVILYNYLLFDGVLSKDRWYTGEDNCKHDLLVQTWGSRVATGNAVCRHSTLLLMDIERQFGNQVEAVDIYILNKFRPLSRLLLERNNLYLINHLVMGFQDNNETLIYDPRNSSFLFKKDNIERNHQALISIDHNFYYYDFDLCFLINGINDYKIDYSKLPPYFKMNKDYLEDRMKKIKKIIENNEKNIDYFHKDHARKIRNLAYLNQNIIDKQNNYLK